MLKPKIEDERLTEEQIRCINDLLKNANAPHMNTAERGFRQKLIDILFKVGYYKTNDSVYVNL